MEEHNPVLALAQAERLAERTSRSARWLARYYVIFGISSLAFALGFGVLSGVTWMIVLLGAWLLLIVGISIYSGRQQTMVRGGARIHTVVMVTWTAIWVLTVTLGSNYQLPWPWWLAGGVGMLATSLVAARVVIRRTGPRP